jgi:hypothetical protein
MKSTLKLIGAVCMAILVCGMAIVYFQHTAMASAEQSAVTGSKIPPGVTPGPETIYGYVQDKNKDGIPGATVTVYNVNVVDGYLLSDGLANIENNPGIAASDSFAGFYSSEGLQPGFYNVTAEIDGHMWFAIVNVTGSDIDGVERNVAIPDYKNPV